MTFDKMPPEYFERKLQEFKELKTFLTSFPKKIKLIGKSDVRIESSNPCIENFKPGIGHLMVEYLLESQARNVPLYADDMMIRALAKYQCGVKAFGIRATIEVLLRKKMISEDKYHESLIRLISLNYHFISIRVETLAHAVELVNFFPNKESRIPFEYLRHADNDEDGLINIAIGFIKWLWIQPTGIGYKQEWTSILLDCITSHPARDKKKIVNELLNRRNIMFSPLLSHVEQQFLKEIKKWQRSQLIVW